MKNILYFLSCVIKPKYTKQPTPQINARYLEPLRTDGEKWGFKFIFD